MNKKRTISQINQEINRLTSHNSLTYDKRVMDLIDKIREENAPQVEILKAELKELENKKPKKKPRWPENTPEDIVEECKQYWKGTEEFSSFRIHCWSDKVICTSYPSGGYSTNGGWNPTPVCFYFISRIEQGYHNKAKDLAIIEGRQSNKALQQKLNELTNIC